MYTKDPQTTENPRASPPPQPTAITADDMSSKAPPALQKRPNAFTELMTPQKKHRSTSPPPPQKSLKGGKVMSKTAINSSGPRNGLISYILHPERNPEGAVVEYDDDFVVIRDKFPKASVHLLLLPRDPAIYLQHPLKLLSSNPAFFAEVQKRVDRLKGIAASELCRQYGRYSASNAPYEAALEALMSSDPDDSQAHTGSHPPIGRDYSADIIAGVHTHPSMTHMHIHIMSREMHSPWLKHKKHYLSFNTSFLVQLHELPLEEGSERYHPGDWPSWDMECWRCGKNFKNQFKQLKEHLEEEFEKWKKE